MTVLPHVADIEEIDGITMWHVAAGGVLRIYARCPVEGCDYVEETPGEMPDAATDAAASMKFHLKLAHSKADRAAGAAA